MFRSSTLTALGVVLTIAAANPAHAGLGKELETMFTGMKNSTPPGVYESQNRMTLDGGGYFERMPVVNTNLVNLEFPSFSGGCGGIDMNFGSFSFINGDQLIQLFTAIGKNAKGYIFQLAMDNVFPEGAKWMDAMQEKIGEMNRFLGNSCQAAQWAVNEVADTEGGKAIKGWANNVQSSIGSVNDDIYSTFSGGDDQSTSHEYQRAKLCETDFSFCDGYGNLMYESFKSQNIETWFVSNDPDILPQLISITGTHIVTPPPVDPSDGASERGKRDVDLTVPGHKITLEQLVRGGDVKIYKCKDLNIGTHTFECGDLSDGDTTISFKGIAKYMEEAINGDAATGTLGIIDRWASPSLGLPNADAKKVMALLPQGVGGMLKAIARRGSPSAAKRAVSSAIDSLAYYAAFEMAEQAIRASRLAINENMTNKTYNVEAILIEASNKYRAELEDRVREGKVEPEFAIINRVTAVYGMLPNPVNTSH